MKVAKSHPAQIYLWAKKSKQLTVEIFGTETETECYSHPFTTKILLEILQGSPKGP